MQTWGYISVADGLDTYSFTFKKQAPEEATRSENSELNDSHGRSRSFRVIETISTKACMRSTISIVGAIFSTVSEILRREFQKSLFIHTTKHSISCC